MFFSTSRKPQRCNIRFEGILLQLTMFETLSILNKAIQEPVLVQQLELLQHTEKNVPNSVRYELHRYKKMAIWDGNDVGMFQYNYVGKLHADNALELKFCVASNTYCENDDCISGRSCKKTGFANCKEKVQTVDVFSFRFTPNYLSQFLKGSQPGTNAEQILGFTYKQTLTQIVPLCSKNKTVLESLFNHTYTDSLENIHINSQIQTLLLYSLECMFNQTNKEDVFQCRFLANEESRDRITKAREILLQHIGEPITIKELAKKVATNECYLKKGFKEMFGTTIFDFYQGQRMEHAKYLLYDKGLSVTDVSLLLGYSSISHFSTAFKKHTGLKPCELLMR